MVSHGPTGVVQASMPIQKVVGMPIIGPGQTDWSPSEWSRLPESSNGAGSLSVEWVVRVPPKVKTGRVARVTKNAPMVTSDMPWNVPCDRFRKAGRPCLPWTKGGQALTTCAACHGIKMSCKTSVGIATREKEVEGPEAADFKEVEVEAIVPDQEGKTVVTKDMPGRAQRPQRTAAVQAQARLERYHKSCIYEETLADVVTVPASILFGRKCPAGDDHPTSQKRARTAEAAEPTSPAELPLFLLDPEELVYPDQDSQEVEDTPQQLPDKSLNYLPISMPATPIAPMSHAGDTSSGLPEYETSSGGHGEEIPDGFCLLPLEDFLVRDSWIAWEQELRWAGHEHEKSLTFLAMRLPPQLVMAEKLTQEEQAQYEIWKGQYLNQLAGIEGEIMEAGIRVGKGSKDM